MVILIQMKKILIEEEEEIILPKKVIGKKELPKKMIVEKELPNVQPEPVKEEVRRYPGYYEIRPFEPLPSIEIKELPKVERPKAEKPKVIARPLEGTPYYVLDKSCVIIDKATCLVIGYWYNGKLVEKQNQDVLDMCRRYNLHFFHPSLLIW